MVKECDMLRNVHLMAKIRIFFSGAIERCDLNTSCDTKFSLPYVIDKSHSS